MKTARLSDPIEAAHWIREGKLVAFPTETVFGLGADATNSRAIHNLFLAKGRPSDNPLIVHLGQLEQWSMAAREFTKVARDFCNEFVPGPLSVILPKVAAIDPAVSANLDTIGLRFPSCQIARDMLTATALPVAAPSANLSGRPSCTRWQSVLEDLDGRIDAILCHNPANVGLESTVVDCCREPPVLLRPGAISLQDLRRVVPGTCALADTGDQAQPLSPGLRHPHYRPRAKVRLFESNLRELDLSAEALSGSSCCGLSALPDRVKILHFRQFANIAEYAMHFYEFLRESDRRGADLIACQLAPPEGIGLALRDRQWRAAGLSHHSK